MSTQESIEAIVEWYDRQGVTTDVADWVETSCQQIKNSYGHDELRLLDNTKAGLSCWALGDDDDYVTYWEAGDIYYDVCHDPNMASIGGADGFYFAPKAYWDRMGYIPDWHTSAILPHVTSLGSAYFADEMQENMYCLPQGKSVADLHRDFQAAGLIHRNLIDEATANTASQNEDYGEVTKRSPPAAAIISAMIREFDNEESTIYDGGEINLEAAYSNVIGSLNGAEKAVAGREVEKALEQVGISPFGQKYADADKDDIIIRLRSAASDPVNNQSLGYVVQHHQAIASETKEPDADLSGMDFHEVYRQALRGLVPQIKGIGWTWDELEGRKGPATEDEIAFYCGYIDSNGRLMTNLLIPDDVFERILPEYGKMTWNDYEAEGASNYHTMPAPAEQYIAGAKAHISGRFAERGFREDPAILLPVFEPLVPVSKFETQVVLDPIVDDFDDWEDEDESDDQTLHSAPTSTSDDDRVSAIYYTMISEDSPVTFGCFSVNNKLEVVEDPTLSGKVNALFSEYAVESADNNLFKVRPMLGQSTAALAKKVRERFAEIDVKDLSESQ